MESGESKRRKLDKNIFYQFTHGSHPDLHSNTNLNGSRSDLASVVKAGHAPSMTPNTMALNDTSNMSRQQKKLGNNLYSTGGPVTGGTNNAFSSSGQKMVHFQDSREMMLKDRYDTNESACAAQEGDFLSEVKI